MMPVTYEFEGDLLILTMAGTYSGNEVLRTYVAALEDPACPPRVEILVDVSRSESLASRGAEELQAMNELAAPYADRIGRRYAVVASPGVLFGMSRMGTTFSEAVGITGRVFTSRAAALEWLRTGAAPADESTG